MLNLSELTTFLIMGKTYLVYTACYIVYEMFTYLDGTDRLFPTTLDIGKSDNTATGV